jgi:hypothetical protein
MRNRILAIVVVAMLPGSALATTYVLRPAGLGDFASIQAAVNASVTGDTIELASGVFSGAGNHDIQIDGKALTIRSQSGDPSTCIIDCESEGRGFHLVSGYAGMILTGITITRGLSDWGGAMRCEAFLHGPEVSDCIFLRNASTDLDGAVSLEGSPTFLRCQFIENAAPYGGAVGQGGGTDSDVSPTFDECSFIRNSANHGGAIWLEVVQPLRSAAIRNCLFIGNSATGHGAAIVLAGASPMIQGCTFVGNSSSYPGLTGVIEACYGFGLENCIFAFSTGCHAVFCEVGICPTLRCCDIYGNAGGDWIGCIADQAGQYGNLSVDPLFCDLAHQDYHLSSESFCAPENNPSCGQIGAYGVGCGATSTMSTSWGLIKAMFRAQDHGR